MNSKYHDQVSQPIILKCGTTLVSPAPPPNPNGLDARLIEPGAAIRSVLIARMSRRDARGMPPVGSAQVDAEGAALRTNLVNSLTNCN